MTKSFWKSGMVAACALALASCGAEADIEVEETAGVTDSSGSTVAEALGEQGSLGMAAEALKATDLIGVLEGDASYTLLAPTDAALEAFGAKDALADEGNGAIVAEVLRSHMIPGAVTLDSIKQAAKDAGGSVTMASFGSGDLTFTVDGDTVTVSDASGAKATLGSNAVVAKNGVIMPIDAVLADKSVLAAPAS